MQKIAAFLWFDGKAEEAMNLYVSLFKNARIVELHRAGDNGPVMSGTFEIDGAKYHAGVIRIALQERGRSVTY